MPGQSLLARRPIMVITLALAAFAAPGAPDKPASAPHSVRGSYGYAWSAFGAFGQESITVDARIVDGVATGSVVIEGWARGAGSPHPSRYEIEQVVTSLDILGHEAWIVASGGGRFDWIAHIVDNGRRGDLVNGVEIRGNFDVRE